MIKDQQWVSALKDSRWVTMVRDPRFVAVVKDPRWVTGALISATTTVVIVGLLAVTQPRGGADPVAEAPASLVISAPDPAADAALGGPAASPTPTATPTAGSKPRTTRQAEKKTPAKAASSPAKPKETKSSRSGAGRSGSGDGRIQFGRTYTGDGTFYAATGAGNCSFERSSNLMVGAMNQKDYENAQACGAHLAVTGPNGTVTIRVVDRCPECPPGAIDLSREAFAKIAPVSAGKVRISWRLLSPESTGPVSYMYKTGSTQWWCGIQVRSHRNPVRSLQVRAGGQWKTLAREQYNYFVSADGSGCGGQIRVTDIYGNRITDDGIRISPDTLQRGDSQFPRARG